MLVRHGQCAGVSGNKPTLQGYVKGGKRQQAIFVLFTACNQLEIQQPSHQVVQDLPAKSSGSRALRQCRDHRHHNKSCVADPARESRTPVSSHQVGHDITCRQDALGSTLHGRACLSTLICALLTEDTLDVQLAGTGA